MSIKNVSFIGLGVMGYPMAGHLQKNGYNVTVFNRTDSKAKKWVEEYGGQMGKTPNEACLNAEIVFMCVGRDQDIIEVMEGNNGILFSAKGGLTIVDHTTASAEIARTYFTKLQGKNISFLEFNTKYKLEIIIIRIPKYPVGACFVKNAKNIKIGIKNQ